MGLYYSKLWNIVDERDKNGKKTWANLKFEEGDGGATVFGDSHHSKTIEFKNRIDHAWTPEKRKKQGDLSRSRFSHMSTEDKKHIRKKAIDTRTKNNPDWRKDLSDRMLGKTILQNLKK